MKNRGGRPGVSGAEVAAAADRIAGRGENPTVRSVLAELGRGSQGTIQRHFTAWKEGHRPAAPVSVALPQGLQRAMLDEIARAAAEARAVLENELAETQAERDGLTDELERQGETLAELEERTQEQGAEIERQAGTIATLERALADSREQATREREAAEAARKAAALAELRLEDLPTLRADMEALRAELKAEREARRLAEVEAAELRGRQAAPGAGGGGRG